jgi:hypothetical protein
MKGTAWDLGQPSCLMEKQGEPSTSCTSVLNSIVMKQETPIKHEENRHIFPSPTKHKSQIHIISSPFPFRTSLTALLASEPCRLTSLSFGSSQCLYRPVSAHVDKFWSYHQPHLGRNRRLPQRWLRWAILEADTATCTPLLMKQIDHQGVTGI